MTRPPSCPRCGGELTAPRRAGTGWHCRSHGPVPPLYVLAATDAEAAGVVGVVKAAAEVPLWVPDPLPPGWAVTGIGYVGEEPARARATVFACAGPGPLGGVADMLLVAEEPGIGLGAGYAGLGVVDPGPSATGVPVAKVEAAGHPTPLWAAPTPADRCAVVGEAKGVWLWLVLWPASAGHVLAEDLILEDLRDRIPRDLPVGGPSPYLWHLYPDDPE